MFKPKFRNDEILMNITECLDNGWTGLGFKTLEIEKKWKEYTGFENAHFLNSNTSGIHLAIKILKDANKWSDGDEIITTPLTFISTNHTILYENLKPVFADIDDFLCLDPTSVESKITKKTRAVLFVGIGGNVGQFNTIVEICRKYELKLILDAAHMSGTWIFNESNTTKEHIGKSADVSIFSFQAVKNLPTADSGMICFKNNDYDLLSRKLSWLGISKDTFQRTNDRGNYKWEYDLVDVGYKYHGNSIMASMAIVGLKYLEDDNKRRREISQIYEKEFKSHGIKSIESSSSTYISSRHLFQIVVNNRNQVMNFLNDNNIFPGVHYADNTKYKMYNFAYGTCPNSHDLSNKIISLPLHLYLTDEDVDFIIEKTILGVKKWS